MKCVIIEEGINYVVCKFVFIGNNVVFVFDYGVGIDGFVGILVKDYLWNVGM